MSEALLNVENVTVSFSGFKALSNVSFTVPQKGVKVLIGPNGAGKSTLLDAIIGKVKASSGRIFYRGQDITRLPEHRIVQLGICRKFQAPGVLESLSVRDNVSLAVRERKGWFANLRSRLNATEAARVNEVLGLIGLSGKPDVLAAHLAHGEKQWLEIGMVVAESPELLLLDEPTAGMTHAETAQTAELINKLAEKHTILVIDHDMAFVELLQAPVSVLHQGRLLTEGGMDEVRQNPEVISVYLGRSFDKEANFAPA